MLQAQKLSRQPRSELLLKEFLLLFGSGPGCLHSAAGEAPYCLDKLPNTQPGGCPITHPLRWVCAIAASYILRLTRFRTSIRKKKQSFSCRSLFWTKLLQVCVCMNVFKATVQVMLLLCDKHLHMSSDYVFCVLYNSTDYSQPQSASCLQSVTHFVSSLSAFIFSSYSLSICLFAGREGYFLWTCWFGLPQV